jgi:ABC-type sugar transport system ATPase subunit
VGLGGLRGAGQELIGQALFGLTAKVGDINLDGVSIAPGWPREAMQAGVSLIWGDPNNGSIVPFLSIKENLFVNQTSAGMRWFSYVAPAKENVAAFDLGRKVGLRPNQPNMPIERFPAAISKRWSWGAGSISTSMFSRTRPPASTSARKPTSTGFSTSRSRTAQRS